MANPGSFSLVTEAEIPAVWLQPPSQDTVHEAARQLHVPSRQVQWVLTVVAPECPEALAYNDWLDTRPPGHDHETVIQGFSIIPAAEFAASYNSTVAEWKRLFAQLGHPSANFLQHVWLRMQ